MQVSELLEVNLKPCAPLRAVVAEALRQTSTPQRTGEINEP